MPGPHGRWRLYPRLLLRRAGFPVDMLHDLADEAVLDAAEHYRRRVARCEEARDRLLQEIPKAVAEAAAAQDRPRLRRLSRLRRAVARRLTDPAGDPALTSMITEYREGRELQEEAGTALREALRAEAARRDGRVAGALRGERAGDALLQLAPSFHEEVERWLAAPRTIRPAAKDRAFLRRAYLYCQRLAAKNETTSFFGPLVHGVVDRDADGIELGAETPSGVHATEAFVAFWAVCRIAESMAADPDVGPRLPVTWIPACRREGSALRLPDGRRVVLSAEQRGIVEAVDGVRGPALIAARTGQTPQTVRQVLERLRRAGAVRLVPEPPSTAPRPLGWLLDLADRHAADTAWPGRLRTLSAAADRYAAAADVRARASALAEVERVFTEITGAAARREGGRMYADRMVVYLDAKGDQSPVRVGGRTARDWEEQLAPVLDLAAHVGELRRRAAGDLCAALLREAGVPAMPYDELIRRSRAAVEQGREADHAAPLARFTAELARLVERRRIGIEAVLDPAELAALHPPARTSRFVSPDLLLESRPGRPDLLVLGELHPYVFAWGSQGLFSDDPAGMRGDFAAHLTPWGGAGRLATVIRRRRHKGLVAEWFPGRFVEITAVATADRNRVLPITDLTVVLRDGRPRLRTPEGELVLYAGEDDHVHLRAFAAPTVSLPLVRSGDAAFAPRIVVGDVLVQRARWWVHREELALAGPRRPDEVFAAVQRLRVTRELPRFVFAHAPGEQKPVGVDLDNPLAVDVLAALAVGSEQPVALSEMRPAPGRLWLRHHGRAHTSEFRLALRREEER
ncbi:hypothetical protein GCM10010517_72450 [Streptosporangium fragile]|uniref:Lantibiotic dehydratase N-terminal domain-containing protein n=1 Tax=Streptosporangium fragile TaxID=46186 RepID=A0ABN3W926_9ACTN